jgi:hypothetical protein
MMLEGAIIGAVVGFIVAIVMVIKLSRRRESILKSLENDGAQAARQQLEKSYPAVTKIPLSKIIDQRERMAALTLIGDTESLSSELAGHTGPITATAQVGSIGILGLALRKDARQAAARLQELSDRTKKEGGKMLGLVKKKTRALASLAKAMCSEPIDAEAWKAIESMSGESGLAQLVIWQSIANAKRQLGQEAEAEAYEAKVRQKTQAFSRPAS